MNAVNLAPTANGLGLFMAVGSVLKSLSGWLWERTMSEQSGPARATIEEIREGFPAADLPLVYADGILNIAPSPQIVKFYLYRTDPNTGGGNTYKNQIVMQVAMHTQGFVAACLFFESSLKNLVANNLISQSQVDEMKRALGISPG
jgi:hypothetical protein